MKDSRGERVIGTGLVGSGSTVVTPEDEEGTDLEKTRGASDIAGYVDSIRRDPTGAEAGVAVEAIARLLEAEFPGRNFTWSVPKGNLARFLLPAIREHRPLAQLRQLLT